MTLKWEIDPLDIVLEYGHYYLVAYSSGLFFILNAIEDAHEVPIERESRNNLDFYIPSKKEVENAHQKGHPSWNLAQRRLKKKLTKYYNLSQEVAEMILFNFCLMTNNNISTAERLRFLVENFGIDIFDGKDELIKLINDFHNNTRQWVLKGHYPYELRQK